MSGDRSEGVAGYLRSRGNRSRVPSALPSVTAAGEPDIDAVTPPRTCSDDSTFVGLYESSYRRLVEIARLTTGSNALAEEIVQDAFADLLNRFETVRNPRAYLRSSVVSRCTSWVRRRMVERRYQDRFAVEPAAWTDPDTVAVMNAIAQLPVRQRAAIVMRYLADWSERDIADALGCRPGTVKSLLARARTTLAKDLSDED
ncbi:MAG: RNA polymerase sigma factor [Acidimicrobiia bacterium]